MDKSFNDQELSDIMKEIEALEEEFNTDTVEASAVMEELAEMEEDKSIPIAKKEAPVLMMEKKKEAPAAAKTSAPTSMAFKVQGDLNLDLKFEIGGQTISLEVSETGLNIQMEGGVTFHVPVSGAHSVKKAV